MRGRLKNKIRYGAVLALAAALLPLAPACAASVSVAVAANFTAPARELAADFQHATGDTLQLSFGSSGQFAAQITQGAPFEVFLSADAARPEKLAKMGLGAPGSVFTYATGKLVLWSAVPGLVDDQGKVLRAGKFAHIAIANPQAAPYGAAAIETMRKLGVYAALAPKFVTGESINQTYQFVATGNAELGFVALSQVIKAHKGSAWRVPQSLYTPIAQDAVLLKPGENDPAARAFMAYLKSPAALAVIRAYGYATTH